MNELLPSVVSALVPVLGGYVALLLRRYVNVQIDETGRAALDKAMERAFFWILSQGRAPNGAEILDYLRTALPYFVRRFALDSAGQEQALKRADAIIERLNSQRIGGR